MHTSYLSEEQEVHIVHLFESHLTAFSTTLSWSLIKTTQLLFPFYFETPIFGFTPNALTTVAIDRDICCTMYLNTGSGGIDILAATKQLHERYISIHPSVKPFSLSSFYRIFMKFSGVITKGTSMQKVKIRSQRSSSQRSKQILHQFGLFQTITPVWIHRWLQMVLNASSSIEGVSCCLPRSFVKF